MAEVSRLSREEERGRTGKVAIASAIISRRVPEKVERIGGTETETRSPLTIYRKLDEMNKEIERLQEEKEKLSGEGC